MTGANLALTYSTLQNRNVSDFTDKVTILGHTYITFGDTSVIALLKKYLQASKLNHVVLLLDDRSKDIDLQNDTAQQLSS